MDVREIPMFDGTVYNDNVEIKERALLRYLQAFKNTSKSENNKWQAQDDHNDKRLVQGMQGYLDQRYTTF